MKYIEKNSIDGFCNQLEMNSLIFSLTLKSNNTIGILFAVC